MRNYVTRLSLKDFSKLHKSLVKELPAYQTNIVALHTDAPKETFYSKELGTKYYVIIPNVSKVFLIRGRFKIIYNGQQVIYLSKKEVSAVYQVERLEPEEYSKA